MVKSLSISPKNPCKGRFFQFGRHSLASMGFYTKKKMLPKLAIRANIQVKGVYFKKKICANVEEALEWLEDQIPKEIQKLKDEVAALKAKGSDTETLAKIRSKDILVFALMKLQHANSMQRKQYLADPLSEEEILEVMQKWISGLAGRGRKALKKKIQKPTKPSIVGKKKGRKGVPKVPKSSPKMRYRRSSTEDKVQKIHNIDTKQKKGISQSPKIPKRVQSPMDISDSPTLSPVEDRMDTSKSSISPPRAQNRMDTSDVSASPMKDSDSDSLPDLTSEDDARFDFLEPPMLAESPPISLHDSTSFFLSSLPARSEGENPLDNNALPCPLLPMEGSTADEIKTSQAIMNHLEFNCYKFSEVVNISYKDELPGGRCKIHLCRMLEVDSELISDPDIQNMWPAVCKAKNGRSRDVKIYINYPLMSIPEIQFYESFGTGPAFIREENGKFSTFSRASEWATIPDTNLIRPVYRQKVANTSVQAQMVTYKSRRNDYESIEKDIKAELEREFALQKSDMFV